MSKTLKHKLLHLSSRHRSAGVGTNSDFTVNLNNTEGVQAVVSMVVKQITIPNVFSNIRDSNRTITFGSGGGEVEQFQIAAGQYTVATLITALEAAITGLTITQDDITGKLTFASTPARNFVNLADGNAMADVLGIRETSVGNVTSYTATGLPSLEGLHNIFIESPEIAQSNLISGGRASALNTVAVIPVNVPYGGVITYTTDHADIDDYDATATVSGKPIQKVSITVKDHEGNVLDLHNHHITMTHKMYYYHN